MSIYTNGSMRNYTSIPPKPVPDDGYPHNAANTIKIMESAWVDLKHLKAIDCEATSLIYGERIGYIPDTTAPKRKPGRTFSGKQ